MRNSCHPTFWKIQWNSIKSCSVDRNSDSWKWVGFNGEQRAGGTCIIDIQAFLDLVMRVIDRLIIVIPIYIKQPTNGVYNIILRWCVQHHLQQLKIDCVFHPVFCDVCFVDIHRKHSQQNGCNFSTKLPQEAQPVWPPPVKPRNDMRWSRHCK